MATDTHTTTGSKTVLKVAKPKKFRVIMHNDDYTTMEFVIEILMSIFNKDEMTAVILMQQIHEKGLAICGIYTKEIAETKIIQTTEAARANKFPLKCTMEEE